MTGINLFVKSEHSDSKFPVIYYPGSNLEFVIALWLSQLQLVDSPEKALDLVSEYILQAGEQSVTDINQMQDETILTLVHKGNKILAAVDAVDYLDMT